LAEEGSSLGRYTLLRLLLLIPTFLGVSLIAFIIMKMTPGDPVVTVLGSSASGATVAALRAQLGLDQPLYSQYLLFLWRILHGNLGNSIAQQVSVVNLIAQSLPNPLLLISAAMVFAIIIGLPIGIIAGLRRNSAVDHAARVGSIFAASLPDYWIGLILIIGLAYYLRLFPVGGSSGPTAIVLPALALGIGLSGILIRLMRSSMLEEMRQNYVRTARSKGLRERSIVLRHVLRNAILPVITVMGLQLGYLLAGDFFVEYIFAWPGLGRLVVSAIFLQDYPVVQGFLLVAASFYVGINLVVDLLYTVIDPRIKLGLGR
jgi:ABC-type dipeptide/oligopeptide/nickel transport system permease component